MTLAEILSRHPDLPVEVCCDRCKWRFRQSTLWRGPASIDGDWIRLDTGRQSRVSRWLRLDEQGSGTGPDGRMLERYQGLCPENKRHTIRRRSDTLGSVDAILMKDAIRIFL